MPHERFFGSLVFATVAHSAPLARQTLAVVWLGFNGPLQEAGTTVAQTTVAGQQQNSPRPPLPHPPPSQRLPDFGYMQTDGWLAWRTYVQSEPEAGELGHQHGPQPAPAGAGALHTAGGRARDLPGDPSGGPFGGRVRVQHVHADAGVAHGLREEGACCARLAFCRLARVWVIGLGLGLRALS